MYESSLIEYKRAWSRHRALAAHHDELGRKFDENKGQARTDELTRSLGALWAILWVDGQTLVEISEREKNLFESCKRLRLSECATEESFKAFLERYRDAPK